MARKQPIQTVPPARHSRAILPPSAIEAMRRVIERVDKLEAEWLLPGLEAGLPYHDAHATVCEQRERARRYIAAHGPEKIDIGVG